MFSPHRHTLLHIAALLLLATCVHAQDSARAVPSRCAGADCIIPRVRDTLDAQAWRYFGLVPAWGKVTSATFTRTPDGVLLSAETEQGPRSLLLTEERAGLLARYLAEFEGHVRWYDGGSAPTDRNLDRLRGARRFTALYTEGLLGLPAIRYGDEERVRAETIGGSEFRGVLLYASNRAVYVWIADEDIYPFLRREGVQRIPFQSIARLLHVRGDGFGRGFLIGASAGFALYSTLLSGAGRGDDAVFKNMTFIPSLLLAGLVCAPVTGLLGGLIGLVSIPPKLLLTNATYRDALPGVRALQAFPCDMPPELRALADPDERAWIDSASAARMAPATEALEDGTLSSSRELRATPVQAERLVGFEFVLNYGWNLYDISKAEMAASITLGVELALPVRLIMPARNRMGLSLRPHIAASTNNTRAGVDLLWHTCDRFHFMTGLDYQTMFENDYGTSALEYGDKWDQSTTLSRLYAAFGLGYDGEHRSFEIQYRIALGTPLYTAGPPSEWFRDPRSLPGNDHGFSALLFRMSWKLR